jgi:hypothetical protein
MESLTAFSSRLFRFAAELSRAAASCRAIASLYFRLISSLSFSLSTCRRCASARSCIACVCMYVRTAASDLATSAGSSLVMRLETKHDNISRNRISSRTQIPRKPRPTHCASRLPPNNRCTQGMLRNLPVFLQNCKTFDSNRGNLACRHETATAQLLPYISDKRFRSKRSRSYSCCEADTSLKSVRE